MVQLLVAHWLIPDLLPESRLVAFEGNRVTPLVYILGMMV